MTLLENIADFLGMTELGFGILFGIIMSILIWKYTNLTFRLLIIITVIGIIYFLVIFVIAIFITIIIPAFKLVFQYIFN